jgi:hypothetical protein
MWVWFWEPSRYVTLSCILHAHATVGVEARHDCISAIEIDDVLVDRLEGVILVNVALLHQNEHVDWLDRWDAKMKERTNELLTESMSFFTSLSTRFDPYLLSPSLSSLKVMAQLASVSMALNISLSLINSCSDRFCAMTHNTIFLSLFMVEKCLRCESTIESHDTIFADHSCRATDEWHGGLASRATGDREIDLGWGDFRPRRDLGGGGGVAWRFGWVR